jgi:hypothetical protein
MSSAGGPVGPRQKIAGGAYVRNFNKAPRGKFKVSMKRAASSRSKSARG